jgi:hypothetical protein
MKRHLLRLLLLFLLPNFAKAQTTSIAEKTKNMTAYNGYKLWDESTGKVWLQIDEFDKEFLYQTSLSTGLGSNDIGLDRGIGSTSIVKFNRVGNKILMIQ